MLKILQARLQQFVNQELLDVQAGFRKGRRTRDQIANIRWIMEKATMIHGYKILFKSICKTSAGSWKKQESSRETSRSALLSMPKPLTVCITINCGKF